VRILLATPFSARDGIAAYSRQVIRALEAAGHEVAVLAGHHADGSVDGRPVIGAVGWRPSAIRALVVDIRRRRPDVVHVQYAVAPYGPRGIPLWIIILALRRVPRIPVAVTFHEVTRDTDRLRAVGRAWYRFIAGCADLITVHTQEAAHRLAEIRARRQPEAVVIPHHIGARQPGDRDGDPSRSDGREGEQPGEQPGEPPRRPGEVARLLLFGYIHVDKGLDVLVDALRIARAARPDVLGATTLVVAGEVRRRRGVMRVMEIADRRHLAGVRAQVAGGGLADVVSFRGYVPDSEIGPLLRASDAVVLPYRTAEQSGVAHLAIAHGVPVIATKVGGLAGLFGPTGLVCEPGNARALADTIIRFLTDPASPDRVRSHYARLHAEVSVASTTSLLLSAYARLESR
jgi:glycosyltransferase involved in cell wall biosynthesis